MGPRPIHRRPSSDAAGGLLSRLIDQLEDVRPERSAFEVMLRLENDADRMVHEAFGQAGAVARSTAMHIARLVILSESRRILRLGADVATFVSCIELSAATIVTPTLLRSPWAMETEGYGGEDLGAAIAGYELAGEAHLLVATSKTLVEHAAFDGGWPTTCDLSEVGPTWASAGASFAVALGAWLDDPLGPRLHQEVPGVQSTRWQRVVVART